MPLPAPQGLYHPSQEHDACGLGFVADLRSAPSHEVIEQALTVLRRLSHRGATGKDPLTSDGAGILIQIPHAYLERTLARDDIELPLSGDYGVAMVFLSRDRARSAADMRVLEDAVRYHNQKVIGWRDVPVNPSALGPIAEASRPLIRQLIIGRVAPAHAFDRTLFMIRKRAGRIANAAGRDDFYVASCSSKTIVYKGLALPSQLDSFYLELRDSDVRSRLALVHSRFSTNTFPTWERAHPYRFIAHNGEINTLRGNQTWMLARESLLASDAFREHLSDFKPIIRPGGSDSASLDNVVDFLVAGGRSLAHVMMMLVPEAIADGDTASPELRAFYEYHSGLVEPWDGPAAIAFTDGVRIGALLDRNGLRPGRYAVTKSGLVVLASEAGVIRFDPAEVAERGRLSPGNIFLVDLAEGRIVPNEEVKAKVAAAYPYREWLRTTRRRLSQWKEVPPPARLSGDDRTRLAMASGYGLEDVEVVIAKMAESGEELQGSMGKDSPLAVLSDRPEVLFRYFTQQFAQVTNPPIDPIRESLVMSLSVSLGAESNLLEKEKAEARFLSLDSPVLYSQDLARLSGDPPPDFAVATVSTVFDQSQRPGAALGRALDRICNEASLAIDGGAKVIVLSDRAVSRSRVAVPSLLAVAAVHHSLIRAGKRMRAGLIVESAEAREVSDIALLIGYGAGAVCPYLALEIASGATAESPMSNTPSKAEENYVHAVEKGLRKILSKMGISTLSSYQGAQVFEALGLGAELIDRYFPGTASALGGIGLPEIALESAKRHDDAFAAARPALSTAGTYAFRAGGERHLWGPGAVASLQRAVRADDHAAYEEYARWINDQTKAPVTVRGLWDFAAHGPPVPLEEVESAAQIVRRFATGAMSFGSISQEAHENLAIAMNRIGGRSNSGEGGEDASRFVRDANGDLRRSAIKQIASARFGVTAHYLVNADELQIKVAQGAKPGEGGQLPGGKVDAVIARVRHSVPGVTLISPPPHHDIYSIEDLAELIHDLRAVNPTARISVKLVAETGVGTVAAGVAKADADTIVIAGHDGGTGAAPLGSIHHAGAPWEIGLAEAQQVLRINGLRSRVRLQTDGQLKTGRDVAFAALLGADEFGFATAPLVASGCVMMRKCHLNTCPVGIATQDPVLRARFRGTPEHVIRYFFFVAEELRAIMAKLGFRTVAEMVGQVSSIVRAPQPLPMKADKLDFSKVLHDPSPESKDGRSFERSPFRPGRDTLEWTIIEGARESLEAGRPTVLESFVENKDRAIGSGLAGEIARRFGALALPPETVTLNLRGSAGQSFGAFATRGMTLSLVGEANDYVGKGLSGGVISVAPYEAEREGDGTRPIIGNTAFYGATSGQAFIAGSAGERFAVRNSGAQIVAEGVGDHGCEYMTGGLVVILGPVGRNFGAGMSGGEAFIVDELGEVARRCNRETIAIEEFVWQRSAGEQSPSLIALYELIEAHQQRTGSLRAHELLRRLRGGGSVKLAHVVPHEWRHAMHSQTPRAAAEAHYG